MTRQNDAGALTVEVRNVGGIDSAEVSVPPGVTVLSGENATNRTSLLTAMAGALGASRPNLKSDADDGEVTLEVDGATFTRRYRRRNGSVTVDGEPYTDDDAIVDLFVSLLEDNPARRAVERGDDLRELVMRPIDTESIERRLRTKRAERDRLRERLEEIDRRCSRLPALEERRAEVDEALSAVRSRIEEIELADGDDPSPAVAEAEAHIQTLERLQRERREVRARIDTEESSIDALRREREDLEAELADLECRDEERKEIEDEIGALRRRERELADSISDLSAINQFNRELLEGEGVSWVESDADGLGRLAPESASLTCWTCGSEVERRAIRERLTELEAVAAERRRERDEVQSRIEALRERRDEIRAAADRHEAAQSRLAEIDAEVDRRESRVEELSAKDDGLGEELASIGARLGGEGDLEADQRARVEELSDLEYERGRLEGERCELGGEISALRDLRDEREQAAAQLDEVESELSCLRSHVEETETAAVETFNEHVEEVLSLLGYRNVARVWLERTSDPDAPAEASSSFALHVVRERDDGTVYEDDVSTLSESEREVLGLVVGLAGYLVYDVGERVPVMLLDSLEAIDGERIAALVDYFADHVTYLLVALLPEDAAAIDFEHARVPASTF